MNLNKLNAKIVEVGIKKKMIAKRFGISVQALNKKLSGITKITIDDACLFCEILNINTYEEKAKIFLDRASQK